MSIHMTHIQSQIFDISKSIFTIRVSIVILGMMWSLFQIILAVMDEIINFLSEQFRIDYDINDTKYEIPRVNNK